MSFFSFFNKKNKSSNNLKYGDYFTKDLLQKIVDNSSLMMIFYTKKDGWIGANQLFFNTFSFNDIWDFRARHKSIRDMFLNESDPIFTKKDIDWLENIKKYNKNGYRLTMFSINNDILSINAKCYTVTHGEELYILELEDYSELKKAELKAKEIEKLKASFLSNIGHEFRTPMNGLLGFVELLSNTNLDSKQSNYLQMINRSSLNLMSNIDTILDYTQMQGGKLAVNNLNFSLSDELEEIIYSLYIQARENKINLLTFIDPRLPRELVGDFKKVKQIMGYLIQNAIKFTGSGGRVIVEVKLIEKSANGGCRISFSVKDNGKGMSNEYISCTRDALSYSNHADERAGVGLSLAYGFVSLLGGELNLVREEGHGSYFSFMLNFSNTKESLYKGLIKKRVKVLLLDQSMINEANLLSTYLSSFGFDVAKITVIDEKIYDGSAAVYVVGNQNNYSWTVDIAAYIKKIPVVMIIDEKEHLREKFTHIVDYVIQRPFLPSKIFKHIHKVYLSEATEHSNKMFSGKKSIHALVVEDNIINQKLIKIILKKYNIKVETAMDGNEAVECCDKNKYDIIFMDIDMPNKNGLEATKEIKSKKGPNDKTPIVALTAMVMHGDKEMLISEGMDDYIAKPITLVKLENLLNKYLNVSFI